MSTVTPKQDVYSALGLAITEIDPVKTNAENPHFNMKYADLNQVLAVVKPACANHGLTLTQLPITEIRTPEGAPPLCLVGVNTILRHNESGSAIETCCLLPCEKLTPQKAGSCISYSKRYTIKAMFCMQDVDDDGQSASVPVQEPVAVHPASTLAEIAKIQDVKSLTAFYKSMIEPVTMPEAVKLELLSACTKRKQEIEGAK
jgi:hypothetical protein